MDHIEKALNHFWKRWRREYLTELREVHHRIRDPNKNKDIAVGDIVLVHDPDILETCESD